VLLLRFTPFLFAALACAGALAASMSTADSQLHAVGTLLTVDVYKKFINPKATGKKLFKLDRWLIVILGLISALVALLKLGIFIELLALATGGMAVLFFPLIAPLYWKRATKTGALLSISLGEATLIATSFISLPWNTLPGLWGVLVSALVLIITSLLTSKMPKIEETVSYLEKAFDKKK
jgi:SSS family solute:Na+ symporter